MATNPKRLAALVALCSRTGCRGWLASCLSQSTLTDHLAHDVDLGGESALRWRAAMQSVAAADSSTSKQPRAGGDSARGQREWRPNLPRQRARHRCKLVWPLSYGAQGFHVETTGEPGYLAGSCRGKMCWLTEFLRGAVTGCLVASLLSSCAATEPEYSPLVRPAHPILWALAQTEQPPHAVVLQQDDSLAAQLAALRLLPADPAATPAARQASMLRFLHQLAEQPELSPPDERAAEEFFVDILDGQDAAAGLADESMLRAFLHALAHHTLPALQVRAMVRLAAWLWQESCPIAGDDGACIQRKNVWPQCQAAQRALLQQTRQRYPNSRVDLLDPCTAGPRYSYAVIPRNPAQASEAQRLLQSALDMARRHHLVPLRPDDDLASALAHAHFLRLEPHFEDQLSQPQWPGSPASIDPLLPVLGPPPLGKGSGERVLHRIRGWLERRTGVVALFGEVNERLYPWAFIYPQTRWAAAAHARMGQLQLDLATQLVGCQGVTVMPPPPGMSNPGEWPTLWRDSYVHCGDSIDAPLLERAEDHFRECELRSGMYDSPSEPLTALCREGLSTLEWPSVHEIRPQPTSVALTLDRAPIASRAKIPPAPAVLQKSEQSSSPVR